MLPRRSIVFLLATAAALLAIHFCILLGGAMREAAVVFCAFALLIGAPIALLAWLGSLPDRERRLLANQRKLKTQEAQTLLWQRTLRELQSAGALPPRDALASGCSDAGGSQATRAPHDAPPEIVPAYVGALRKEVSANRPILALCLAVASATGLGGCETIELLDPDRRADRWMMVQPGIGTAELVSLVGGPDYVRSNGTTSVWQYCRDRSFPIKWRDEGRNARYYMAVLVDNDLVREVRPYPVYSHAGCQDFYRAEF